MSLHTLESDWYHLLVMDGERIVGFFKLDCWAQPGVTTLELGEMAEELGITIVDLQARYPSDGRALLQEIRDTVARQRGEGEG